MGATPAAAASAAPKRKPPPSSSFFSLGCGCKDANSVSVTRSRSDSSDRAADPAEATSRPAPQGPRRPVSGGPETASARDDDVDDDEDTAELAAGKSPPSFSALLRQPSGLERHIAGDGRCGARWGLVASDGERRDKEGDGESGGTSSRPGERHRSRHRRSQSEGRAAGGRRLLYKVEESVAVVKQTEDPLGDFRRSMLQMIVEKEILSGEELRELLCLFLALNSPSHHALIVRAFADVWRDVFSGYSCYAAVDALRLPPAAPRRRRLPPSWGPGRGVTGGGFSPPAAAAAAAPPSYHR